MSKRMELPLSLAAAKILTRQNSSLTSPTVHILARPTAWEGIVTVDGTSYEDLGTGSENLPALPNLKARHSSDCQPRLAVLGRD